MAWPVTPDREHRHLTLTEAGEAHLSLVLVVVAVTLATRADLRRSGRGTRILNLHLWGLTLFRVFDDLGVDEVLCVDRLRQRRHGVSRVAAEHAAHDSHALVITC